MTTDPLRRISTRATPQSRPADPRQVPNSAGGYAFTVDPVARLRRFLVLGTAGGTYHVGERELTLDNAQVVVDLASSDHATLVATLLEVSEAGRVPRQEPTLFALAVACSTGTAVERRAALDVLPRVARTATMLFTFLNYVQQFRGWGRGLRRGVSAWYLDQDVADVAFQAVKYRQRVGWTHRDVLRKAHPERRLVDGSIDARRSLFDWICGRGAFLGHGPEMTVRPPVPELRVVEGYERLRRTTGVRSAAELVRAYRLPWETLPDHLVNRREIWEALLDNGLPLTALTRQLPRLTRLGLLLDVEGSGGRTAQVVARLTDADALRRARVHPLAQLLAQRTYASGRSERGTSTWTPSRRVIDALDASFYAAFGSVEPTGRRLLLALDVSGSMARSYVARTSLSAREASGALALVTLAREPSCAVVGFTGAGPARHTWAGQDFRETPAVSPLTLSSRQRLDDAVRYVRGLSFGPTDCAQPMLYALEHGLEVDAFVIYTDSESWVGSVHPHQALRWYRERTGIPARLVVVALTATEFTVADPDDPRSLDVVGLDAATPQLISDFVRGDL